MHLSPILTIVAYGITVARSGGPRVDPLLRLKSYAVWETVVFLSNVLAFSLIGLQLGPLLEKLSPEQRIQLFHHRRRGSVHRDPHPHRLGDDL